eukprot:TRINITY_DN8598_c0_g1_i1.p1 TRINITY_DN8598_c0_g1~~TRINITY_DN8598_c0_g1_i1.p1  ORF type:complete len:274 (+),score=34.08 TRINITY_DN8598_c0_g1_i1:31-852(+)
MWSLLTPNNTVLIAAVAIVTGIVVKRRFQKKKPETWISHVKEDCSDVLEVVPGIWTVDCSLMAKNDHFRRMIIYRLPTGGLLVESCIAMNDDRMQRLDALGKVEIILVPNKYHRLDCGVYKTRYPSARVLCPQTTRSSCEEVCPVDGTCEDVLPQYGIKVLDSGLQKTGELAYALPLSDGTQAMLLSDFVFNMHHGGRIPKLLGMVPGPGDVPQVARLFKWFMMKNKAQSRRFLSDAMEDRTGYSVLLMSHGKPIVGSVEKLRAVFAHIAKTF